MNRKIIATALSGVVMAMASFVAAAQDLLGIDGEEATSIGVYIKDLKSGEVLYDYNSELALTPASVMKLVTSATALSLLGEDYRFTTAVELRGDYAPGDRHSWRGDLVVCSSGDPTLESENFKDNLGFCDSIAVGLRRLGITSVEGRIVVEQTMKDAGPVAQWEIEDIAWPYGAGLFGFNYLDNTFTVYPLTGETKPFVPGFEVEMHKSDDSNDMIRGVYSDRLVVFSRNTTKKKWSVRTTMPDPSAVFVYQLTDVLKRNGISVGEKEGRTVKPQTKTVHVHRSPTAKDMLRSLMVRSDNLFAEGMLRAIAPSDSRSGAIKREKELWTNRGVNADYTIINDGSGLTRANRLSPRFIGDVLQWMSESRLAATYAGLFPKAGMDGTMRTFLSGTSLEGKIALKTGSVSSVQTYAGYMLDDEGLPTHVIVVMVNGFFCKRADVRKAVEQLLIDTFQ